MIMHPVVMRMFCGVDDERSCPIMQLTCPLCLCELGVDDVSRLDQRSAGLDHLEDKEDV